MRTALKIGLTLPALLLLNGCIRTQNYHPNGKSTYLFNYSWKDNSKGKAYGDGYFFDGTAREAYIEFDARGAMFRDRDNHTPQLDAALSLIKGLRQPNPKGRPQRIALYVFIHGWKNNASESSGNVWGFRRFLPASHPGSAFP